VTCKHGSVYRERSRPSGFSHGSFARQRPNSGLKIFVELIWESIEKVDDGEPWETHLDYPGRRLRRTQA
jgi:hypothetical protein